MKFDIRLKLNLDFLGEGWKDCYLAFSPLTVKDAKELRDITPTDKDTLDKGMNLLKDKFIEGTALSNGKLVTVKKTDLDEMPMSVINKSIELMVEAVSEVEKKIPN